LYIHIVTYATLDQSNINTHAAATSLLVMSDVIDTVPKILGAAVIFTQQIKRNGFSLEFLL
jgi:hypothetical protein